MILKPHPDRTDLDSPVFLDGYPSRTCSSYSGNSSRPDKPSWYPAAAAGDERARFVQAVALVRRLDPELVQHWNASEEASLARWRHCQ